MAKSIITRRLFLKKALTWCGMAAIPCMTSVCGGRNILNSSGKSQQLVAEAPKTLV